MPRLPALVLKCGPRRFTPTRAKLLQHRFRPRIASSEVRGHPLLCSAPSARSFLFLALLAFEVPTRLSQTMEQHGRLRGSPHIDAKKLRRICLIGLFSSLVGLALAGGGVVCAFKYGKLRRPALLRPSEAHSSSLPSRAARIDEGGAVYHLRSAGGRMASRRNRWGMSASRLTWCES